MLALLLLIPLYLLALTAILDALMTRRYPIGSCSDWRLKDAAVTQDMKRELIYKWGKGLTPAQAALFEYGNQDPLCGWGYAYQYQDFNPPCELELKLSESERYTMKAVNQAIVSEAVRGLMREYRKSERTIKRQEREYARANKSRVLVPAMA